MSLRSLHAFHAALLLLAACAVNGQLRFVAGLPLVIAALVFGIRAVTTPFSDRTRIAPQSLWIFVAATVALGIVSPNLDGPMWFDIVRLTWSAVGVVLVGLVATRDPAWRRRALAVAVLGSAALYFATPTIIGNPQIDVVAWTSTATRALLHGIHPYTVVAPDVYDGGSDFGFAVQVYPYMKSYRCRRTRNRNRNRRPDRSVRCTAELRESASFVRTSARTLDRATSRRECRTPRSASGASA